MYEAYYNLEAKPFQLTPDPQFFFNSRGHKRALSYLRYGIKQGEGFIIVTGDVGTGKTTLVGMLFQTLAQENVVATQVVTTQMQADDLLRMVAAGFGLPYQRVTKAGLLKSLEGYFRACVQEGKRVLLVVDEAQGLPHRAIEELRMLSNFTYGGRSLLQSFLLGQREFRQTMRSEGFEQLRQRVIAAYHLRPLDEDETRGYVEHRLHTVGWADDPRFTAEAFRGIHGFTEGVPRRINTLCDRLLLFGYLEELHEINYDSLQAVAQDILEEQGGDIGPEPRSMFHQHDATQVRQPEAYPPLTAEHGPSLAQPGAAGGPSTSAAADPVAGPGAARPASGEPGADDRSGNVQGRLAAVESNMASLTDSVRDELARLRQVLLDEARNGRKDD
jgi:general secretion pathway protein A